MTIDKNSKWRTQQFMALLKEIKKNCTGKVLDVGCGRGEFVFSYKNADGIDVQNFVEWKQDKRFKVMKAENLSTVGYGTILFNNSLEHLKNKEQILNKVNRFEGKVIFVMPTLKHLLKCWSRIPLALIKKVNGEKHENIKYLLIHSPEVYTNNFIKTFTDFLSWNTLFQKYFNHIEIKQVEDYSIYVCTNRVYRCACFEGMPQTRL